MNSEFENEKLKKKAFSGMIWKFAERFFAQFVSLVITIILARILTPSDYAPISIITIFYNFANILIVGGFNSALIQKKEADDKDYSTVLVFSLCASVFVYIVLFIFAPQIASLYKNSEIIDLLRVMGVILFINAFSSVLTAKVSSTLQFKKSCISTIISTIISAIVGILLAKLGYGSWALVAQQISNAFINTIVLLILLKFNLSFVMDFSRLKKMFKYGSRIFLATLVGAAYEEISPLVIGIKFTTVDLTYYDKGRSFPSLINSAFNDTLASVLFPTMAKVQDSKELVLSYTRRFMRTSSFLIFPFMVGFFCISDSFINVILTEKWIGASPYLKIFCFSYMFNIIQNGNLQAIKAIGRSDIVLKMEVLKKSIYLIVLFSFILYSHTPIMLAIASCINTIIATIINTYPNRKLINYSYKLQIKDLLPNLLSSIAMGVIVYSVSFLNINSFLLLCIQIAIGVFSYCIISLAIKNENFFYILDLLKHYIN